MPVDPETLAAVGVLVAAQDASRRDTLTATQRAVESVLRNFGGWYDGDAIGRMAKSAAASTRAGQKQTTTNVGTYWSRVVSLVTGRRVNPGRLVDVSTVRPVPLDAVYGRVADQYRYLTATRGPDTTPDARLAAARDAWQRRADRLTPNIAAPGRRLSDADIAQALRDAIGALPEVPPDPLTLDDILSRAIQRGMVAVDDNLSLAYRAQLEQAAKSDPSTVTGYRRVIRPELSAGGTCGLCVAVSTRLYFRGDLLPLHSRCKCTVIPVIGEAGGDGDIGGAINDMDLAALYDQAGGNRAAELKRTRYKVIRHAELGSWLVPADSLQDGLPDTGTAAAAA